MLYPEDRYVMVPMEDFRDRPEQGGRFILTDFETSVSSVISSRAYPPRFTFHFSAPRYKLYYFSFCPFS
jgi:hypothetical protein